MEKTKLYDILELSAMSIIDLTSIAQESKIEICNNFKQSMIYAILDRQEEAKHKPSDSNWRDRYAVAESICPSKTRLL